MEKHEKTQVKTDMEHQPIKRSKYVVTLSRDHHAGLLFCWKIKQGLKQDIPFQRINSYVNYFWENHLIDHFREEEILLFNQADHELTRRAKAEHLLLTEWFCSINSAGLTSKNEYLAFTELLTMHIRFEERVLFGFLESHLPENTLVGIHDILLKLHREPFLDNYPDDFWSKQKSTRPSADFK